jgi:hypothetical protein
VSAFCDYLLKKGRITELEFFRARSRCASLNLNTGSCAHAFGFIGRGAIERVLGIQKRTGQKFGEIAVALGLLTPGQVRTILRIQEKYRVNMEDALVRDGVLTTEELEKERELFENARESSR